MRLFDFRCPDGHKFEDFVSPVRSKLEGISGDFPDAHDKWAKRRKQQIAHERKQYS